MVLRNLRTNRRKDYLEVIMRQFLISKCLVTATQRLVLCSAYKLALTAGQGDLGAKRGGRCIDEYYHDERQSPQPFGPRQQGWPETGHLRRRSGSMGLMDPVFAARSLHLAHFRPI